MIKWHLATASQFIRSMFNTRKLRTCFAASFFILLSAGWGAWVMYYRLAGRHVLDEERHNLRMLEKLYLYY